MENYRLKHNMDSYCLVGADGTKRYFNENNLYHREDGPAIEYPNGDKIWWNNGNLHRFDGPAVEFADDDNEWYINGKRLSLEKEAILNQWWNNKNGI
jgi:hypothetical protein